MKKIIISGSSSGIGRAISQRLLSIGHTVIGLGRDHTKFNPGDPHYIPYSIDFSHPENANTILRTIQQQHHDIDVIIGNAGYGKFANLEQFSTTQICDLVNVNLIGQVLLVKNFLPNLKKKRHGKIILIGSEAALKGAKQGSIYCATKFAVRGFAQSLRHECSAAGIAVTLVNPGLVNSQFFEGLHFRPGPSPENALLPEDIADNIIHLINLDNRYVVDEINIQELKHVISRNSR